MSRARFPSFEPGAGSCNPDSREASGSSDALVDAGDAGAVDKTADPAGESGRREDPRLGIVPRASSTGERVEGDDARSVGESERSAGENGTAGGAGELPMCAMGDTTDRAGEAARKIGEAKCGRGSVVSIGWALAADAARCRALTDVVAPLLLREADPAEGDKVEGGGVWPVLVVCDSDTRGGVRGSTGAGDAKGSRWGGDVIEVRGALGGEVGATVGGAASSVSTGRAVSAWATGSAVSTVPEVTEEGSRAGTSSAGPGGFEAQPRPATITEEVGTSSCSSIPDSNTGAARTDLGSGAAGCAGGWVGDRGANPPAPPPSSNSSQSSLKSRDAGGTVAVFGPAKAVWGAEGDRATEAASGVGSGAGTETGSGAGSGSSARAERTATSGLPETVGSGVGSAVRSGVALKAGVTWAVEPGGVSTTCSDVGSDARSGAGTTV